MRSNVRRVFNLLWYYRSIKTDFMNYSKNELTHSCGSSSSKKIKASLRFEWTSLPFMLSHRSSQLFSWDSEKCSWRKSTSCIYDFIQAYEHTCCAHSTHKPIYAEAHFQMERENPRSERCIFCIHFVVLHVVWKQQLWFQLNDVFYLSICIFCM